VQFTKHTKSLVALMMANPDEERAIVEQAPLRSEMTDDELETWKSAVYETRGKQREKAREGEFIKTRLTGSASLSNTRCGTRSPVCGARSGT